MELSEKIKLVSILNELARAGELDICSSGQEELLPEENIRIIYIEEGVITICLSEKFIKREE